METILNAELLKKGVLIKDEYFWYPEDACTVVEKCTGKGYFVIGVEVMEKQKNSVKWVATSNYAESCHNKTKEAYKEEAINFINQNRYISNGVFSLSIDKRDKL